LRTVEKDQDRGTRACGRNTIVNATPFCRRSRRVILSHRRKILTQQPTYIVAEQMRRRCILSGECAILFEKQRATLQKDLKEEKKKRKQQPVLPRVLHHSGGLLLSGFLHESCDKCSTRSEIPQGRYCIFYGERGNSLSSLSGKTARPWYLYAETAQQRRPDPVSAAGHGVQKMREDAPGTAFRYRSIQTNGRRSFERYCRNTPTVPS